jgi:hypothetical protein
VAVVAEEGEPDRLWLMRATVARVDIVCSPDKEVGTWTHDGGRVFVRLAGNRKERALLKRVRAAWQNAQHMKGNRR